jgi:UDP-2-acetamido-3-amino-2,3-dideoxy-glucuronate N-acetyltransferase
METTAVVGIGRWGKNLLRCFDSLSTVRYCCHAGDPDNAAWLAERHPDVTRTESFEAVLTDDAVDAVVLATPIDTHASLVRRTLQANKHVFVEKPLATEGEAANELVDLAADRDRCLFTGYVFLYAPGMRELWRRTRDDPVRHLRAHWRTFGTFEDRIAWSLACHDVAIAHHLFGEPLVTASTTEAVGVRTEGDLLSVDLRTDGGRTLAASYDRTARQSSKSIVAVTAGGHRYEFADDRLYELRDDDHVDVTPTDPDEPLVAECEAFLDAVAGGEPPPTAGRFGARVTEVVQSL